MFADFSVGLLLIFRLGLLGLPLVLLLLVLLLLLLFFLLFLLVILLVLLVLILILFLILLLFLFLLLLFLLLLLLQFLFGHLKVAFGICVARSQAKTFFIRVHGFFVFLLFQERISEVVQSVGFQSGIRRRFYGLFETFGCVVPISLLVKSAAEVVQCVSVAVFSFCGFPVLFFGLLVVFLVVLAIAFAKKPVSRLPCNRV